MKKDKIKKCKVKTKETKGKVKVEMRGYCDPDNPNIKTDRDFEIEIPDL